MESILSQIDKNLDKSIGRLCNLLQIPSISTDPTYKKSCDEAADWLKNDLESIGFDVSVFQTNKNPIVLSHYKCRTPGRLSILFYGHYDVQPVDPISLWKYPPFSPELIEKDGRKMITARGVSDDKGPVMTFIEACRSYREVCGDLPVNITILLEGEEECGSNSLPDFLKQNKDLLKANLGFICDTSMWDRFTPSISVALRGVMCEEITVMGAARDLHSGEYGGAAANPIKILSRMCAALHDDQGRVTLPNFYEGVEEVPSDILKKWHSLEETSHLLKDVGLQFSAGEKAHSVLEAVWSRPTLEFNGLFGGYIGEGFKTVIPQKATVKISCRLVGTQSPEKIRDSLRQFMRERVPADCSIEFVNYGSSLAFKLENDSSFLPIVKKALSNEWDREALLIYGGGSIPIVNNLKTELNIPFLLVGSGLEDDAIHSPNEKYDVNSFYKGQRSWVRILDSLKTLEEK